MKQLFLSIIGILTFFFSIGQNLNGNHKVTTRIKILVNEIDDFKNELDGLISSDQTDISHYYIDQTKFNLTVNANEVAYTKILNQIKKYGITISENTSSNNYTGKTDKINDEIDLLKREKAHYQNLISEIDSVERIKYFEYWEKIISIDKAISTNQSKVKLYQNSDTRFQIKIEFFEEEIINNDYSDTWVNMPGFELSFLRTEQPKFESTPEQMTGYNLKYMVNRQKSYISLGLYKANKKVSPGSVNEMYIFGIGQDFYSKKLGRGTRKYLNLYTSFNLGVYITSSELERQSSWYTNPFIGLELIKTKYILIDNKVGYFLPFKNNRNQRGLLYNVSFNFVF